MSLPDPLWFTGAAGMCGIAAVLVAVFLKDFRLAIELAAVAVFLGLCAGVAYGYEDKGIAKQVAKDKPIIDNLTANLATSGRRETATGKECSRPVRASRRCSAKQYGASGSRTRA